MARWTLADSSSTIVFTDGTLTTWVTGAWVKVAVGVWVSGVVGTTFAHSIAKICTHFVYLYNEILFYTVPSR